MKEDEVERKRKIRLQLQWGIGGHEDELIRSIVTKIAGGEYELD